MAAVKPKEQLELDPIQEQGFLSFLRNLGEKPATTFRLFDRGDYYTVHREDAVFTAKNLFRTNSVIKYLGSGDKKIESCCLGRANFEALMRDLLLVKQYRVEVYKQKSSSKNDWHLEFTATPGNLTQFEEILFGVNNDLGVTSGVIAIKLATLNNGQKMVGVGYVDTTTRKIYVSEFSDNDAFNNLEALIVQLGPKECLLPNGDLGPSGDKLKQVLSRNNLLVTEVKKLDFTNKDAAQDLGRLVRVKSKDGMSIASWKEMERTYAISSVIAIIKYLDLLSNEGHFKQYKLQNYDLNQYMRLDSAAMKALHIEPNRLSTDSMLLSRNGTLTGLLDKCRTSQGHRLMAQWLRQPLVDINRIMERQDLVEAIVASVELRHSLGEEHLKRIPDLHRIIRKLSRKAANLQDLYKLYQCISRLPHLCEAIASYDGEYANTMAAVFTSPFQELLNDMTKYQEMIETTMDLDQAGQGEYVVKPDFDDSLLALREQMNDLESNFQIEHKKVANDLHLEIGKSLKLESNSQHGYFFRVTLKDEKCIRNNRHYKILDTNKAGIRFRNNQLQSYNEEYISTRDEYAALQKSVVDEIVTISCGYVEVIQTLASVLATLDCVYALAVAAVSAPIPYVRPILQAVGQGTTKLDGCRHPCLELQDDVSFIPNNCHFSSEGGQFHIITGPNMGGKSTYLRSVGLAVLMAQVGSFVACDQAQISIVDGIYARVGAGDCQLKGVSTFMAEMIETSTILHSASKNSLIIIDELGRGTSTYDGFGLAWAISEYIAKDIKANCLFATHFHELTDLEADIPTVKNYHVTATTSHGALTLLYQVQKGPCDRSFGIHVAELAHFPPSVIEFAKRIASELEVVLDDNEDDDDSEEATKRRKIEKQGGEEIIDAFITQVDSFDMDEIEDEDFNRILKLMKDLKSTSVPYIKKLLSNIQS